MNKALNYNYQETGTAESYNLASAGDSRSEDANRVDSLLLPLMRIDSPVDSDDALSRLITEHARPVIRGIIKKRLHVSLNKADGRLDNQDALEIDCAIQVELIVALRRMQREGEPCINNFQGYVAAITFNACHDYLRRKYPRRHSLQNKLRYLLRQHPDFSIWEIDGAMYCGLTAWRFQRRAPASYGYLKLDSANGELRALHLTVLVCELFRQVDGPIELKELVSAVAQLKEIKDERLEIKRGPEEEEQASHCESLRDSASVNPLLETERRLYLRQLWSEICQLPQRQRAALLLNLKDSQGCGGISLFPVTGVASVRQVAEALEMEAEELAAMWNELPLDDVAIAERLRLTRQQVINLRKSARERLARRMKVLWC